LPIYNVSIGDTYIVSKLIVPKENDIIQDILYAGDLLVANGTEENGKITSGLNWIHVRTGYIESHNSKLQLDEDDNII
jgi:hypothetical protein